MRVPLLEQQTCQCQEETRTGGIGSSWAYIHSPCLQLFDPPHAILLSSAPCCSLACLSVTGTSKHEQDEAYEEAAYLKTNRFLAAYVVDEQSRASYVNDLLNEGFEHVRSRCR